MYLSYKIEMAVLAEMKECSVMLDGKAVLGWWSK
jgi:hypothetical protein